METKICGHCKKRKLLSQYHKNPTQKHGLNNWCRVCCSEYIKNYSEEHKEYLTKYRKKYNIKNSVILNKKQAIYRENNRILIRIRKLKYKFNISFKEAEELYNRKINGVCNICGKPESCKKFMLAVDHNHKTGNIRGLLCSSCNKGLGHFMDDINILNKAIKYLKTKG